jgi:hypothetical protein
MFQENKIKAFYSNDFIRVYQAFNDAIADSAIKEQRFITPPFNFNRSTWIKPSFLWMMYRSGWATKENQNRVLAIDISYEGFRWALQNSCLSHFNRSLYNSQEEWNKMIKNTPVIVQWDPERDILLNKLNQKTIQIGLKPAAVTLYNDFWILKITDVTNLVKDIKKLIDIKKLEEAQQNLPVEKIFDVFN